MGLVNVNPFRAQGIDDYLVDLQFATNDTSAPDGLAPDYGDDLALARDDVGLFTLTFAGDKKPLRVRGFAEVLGDEPDMSAKVVSYDPDTGVVTVAVYVNVAGTIALDDTTDKTIQVFLFCSKSRRSL
jgi:hypothetical protein